MTIEVEIGEKKVGSKLSFFPLQILARIPASMKRVQKYLLTRLKLNFENKKKKKEFHLIFFFEGLQENQGI